MSKEKTKFEERPGDGSSTTGVALKHIMTTDVPKAVREPLRATPVLPGPRTGDGTMSDGQFVATFATPEELAAFRSAVEARRAKDPENLIWERCDRCRVVLKVKPDAAEGDTCPACNWARRPGGGHMFRMKAVEIDAYLREKAAQDKAADERANRAAFIRRNTERGTDGLPPLTIAEFKAEQQAAHRKSLERAEELAKIGQLYRRKT